MLGKQLNSQNKQTALPWSKWHSRLHKKLLGNPNLLPKGETLLVAVSGGQDSMALLGLLLDLKRLHDWQINIWHGDHGWHKQSAKTAKELKHWCEERNLKYFSNTGTLQETKGENLARKWRYENLKNTATIISTRNPQAPCLKVLTAHTASDRAETFLLNLIRGTDLAGLGSMNIERILGVDDLNRNIKIIRPLLSFEREETNLICQEMNLPLWSDPSNENENLKRNKIRKSIFPIFEELNPGCSRRIASLSERISNYKINQEELIKLAAKNIQNGNKLCREDFNKLSITTRTIILKYWINDNGGPNLSSVQLEEIIIQIYSQKGPLKRNLFGGWIIFWDKTLIQIRKQIKEP